LSQNILQATLLYGIALTGTSTLWSDYDSPK